MGILMDSIKDQTVKVTDEELMSRYRHGEAKAFEQLYRRHCSSLYRYFCRQLPANRSQRAEELYQEVWYRVIAHRENYQVTAKFTTWLYRIAHNLVIDEHRKGLRLGVVENPVEGEFDEPDPTRLDENDLLERKRQSLRECMGRLAPLQREAFLLKNESGFSNAEISEIVSAKAETIKTRLRYALDNLRECLTHKLGARS